MLLATVAVVATVIAGGAWMFILDMPGRSHHGPLPPLTAQERAVQENLQRHVEALAGAIGERNVWRHDALERAANYIEDALRGLGDQVVAQPFQAEGKPVRNLEVERRGSSDPDQVVVVGAHYDSVIGSPGANDNGSGAAALIEIGRLLKGYDLARTLRLVAFVNEEPPFSYGELMGSRVYAERARQRNERIVAMLSLETIGYYSDAEGSQHYPPPFQLFYPERGNFIGFVTNLGSRRLVRQAIGSFRRHTRFPSEGVAAPGWVTGVGWSDHWSFWQQGYPAIMVTDTALFRYPYYHSAQDTPDKVDYERTARVVAGLARVVADLAGGGSG